MIQEVVSFNVIEVDPVELGIKDFFGIRIIVSINDFLPRLIPKLHPKLMGISVVTALEPGRTVMEPTFFPIITVVFG